MRKVYLTLLLVMFGLVAGATVAQAEEPPGVPDLECPEGYVPGWLDENGNPTSCVNNEPNPGAPSPEPEPSITTEVGEPAGPIDTPAPEEVVSVEKAPAAAAVKADTETFTVTYTG